MHCITKYCLLLLIPLMVVSGCKKEEPDYTYSILNLYWPEEGSDADQDGFVTSRSLQCEFDLLEPVTRDVELVVYCKNESMGDYVFYRNVDHGELTGGNSAVVVMTIGAPEELNKGTYSFIVELHEKGNIRVEAADTIHGQKFERLINDQIYNMNIVWSAPKDLDADGFWRSALLMLDVNVQGNYTKKIRAEVFTKKMDTEEEFRSIYEGDLYMIYSNFPDFHYVEVGLYPDTLSHARYEFRIIIYEEQSFNPVLIYDASLSELLGNRMFETDLEDGYLYSLNETNLKWVDILDQDGDGYARSKTLSIDVDIDKPDSVSVYLKILRKLSSDSLFDVLDSTSVFKVSGKSALDVMLFPLSAFNVTDSVKMPHGEYDLMLTLYEIIPGYEPDMRFAVDSINGKILQRQKFELDTEDL